MFRLYDTDGMRQRIADQVGIEQRNHAADTRYPKPDRHVLRAIWHEQTDDIAKRQALSQRPLRISFGSLGKLAIGQVIIPRKKSWRSSETFSQRIDQNRQGS